MPVEPGTASLVDSNVWLYAFIDQNEPQKLARARQLIRQSEPVVSTQILNEVCYNLMRKAGFSGPRIGRVIRSFYARYVVVPVGKDTMLDAVSLRNRYSFSFWDSLVVAAALQANCSILYSEDMQDGLLVEARLRIINPFQF